MNRQARMNRQATVLCPTITAIQVAQINVVETMETYIIANKLQAVNLISSLIFAINALAAAAAAVVVANIAKTSIATNISV